ncbi:MAG: hypothetical protein JWQ07_3214 [Ramlibacter sp.]|nr:hypothetical protein [Ramlibacter sp.]
MSSTDYTIDWDRCIHLSGPIGEESINRLAPAILQLRQRSHAPITVAINSLGGSIATIDTLYALLSGPNQYGQRPRTITVVTHRAYSAAATFLTLGDYAVALPHSSILFHDIRYGEMEDVTPTAASLAARQLAAANESLALRLAHPVFKRLTWLYIDLRHRFGELTKASEAYAKFKESFEKCGAAPAEEVGIDLAALATVMHDNLTPQSQQLLKKAVQRLRSWKMACQLGKRASEVRRGTGQAWPIGWCKVAL